jgi:hypothetical protein
VTAALTALAAASTFLGASAFWDARGYFDALAIGLVLAAMACRAVAPVALLVLLAAFTDERALGAGLLACFWFVVRGRREGASGRARWLPRPAWGVLLATAAYVGARQVLARRFGLATPIGETAAVGLDQLRGQLTSMPFGVWSVLEGLWLPVLAGFALLWRRWRLPSGIVILVLALQLLSAHCVWDVTRSGMYVFPVVFVSAAALARVETPDTVRALFLLATLVCVLAPTGHLQANEVHLCRPVTAWIALSLW